MDESTASMADDKSPRYEVDEPIAKVPNSPASAFASLSLDGNASAGGSIASSSHRSEIDGATHLVEALDVARRRPKPLIRSTGHRVSRDGEEHHLISWKTSEFAYRKSSSVGSELPTLARGLFTERLVTRDGSVRHRIAVRGYDKFFNLGEMPWTKPDSIKAFTMAPYILTFKENGCIIFIAALSPDQLVVTSKHSLGSLDGVTVTHAQKGEEWLDVHLQRAGKTRRELAQELWRRNETAVFELCDDSFEEHVLAYSADKSGLHLHGLNANSATFRTRPMAEVDAFARAWGFIPTRYMEIGSLAELHELTDRIGTSGSWDGEAIEGFVIRTHMPPTSAGSSCPSSSQASASASQAEGSSSSVSPLDSSSRGPVSPPYAPGQAWFYKVKFDEPYLMYRDWRELTRKMITQKAAWEKTILSRGGDHVRSAPALETSNQSSASKAISTTEGGEQPNGGQADLELSKNAAKKERKKAERERREAEAKERAAAIKAGIAPPEPPQSRSKRPETVLFIQWCYSLLYGTTEVRSRPELFATFAEGKGIIALRNAFLDYLQTPEGRRKLTALGGASSLDQAVTVGVEQDSRPFTKTVIAPVAIPGCGKTVLAVALSELFGFAHVQSDDFKGKKGFLAQVEREIQTHDVLFADKNNHLFQQRDELIELVQKVSDPNQPVKVGKAKKKGGQGGTGADTAKPSIPRIRTVALAWQLDALPLNALHRICSDRIVARGDNHQTLRADTSGAAGTRDHETILWRFLEQLQPFGSAMGGEGSEGFGDAKFDKTIWLSVDEDLERTLRNLVKGLCSVLGLTMPSEARLQTALQRAIEYKTPVKKETKSDKKSKAPDHDDQTKQLQESQNQDGTGEERAKAAKVRYYGIAVELDLISVLRTVFDQSATGTSAMLESGRTFFERLRAEKRITLRPHITLVHSAAVAREKEEQQSTDANVNATDRDRTEASGAGARWERYASLCQSGTGSGEVEFSMVLDRLIWDGRVMALSVRDVSSEAMPDFAEVQGGRGGEAQGVWRPHITVGTASVEIRPVEANRAMLEAERGNKEVAVVPLGPEGSGIRAKGRLQGMNH